MVPLPQTSPSLGSAESLRRSWSAIALGSAVPPLQKIRIIRIIRGSSFLEFILAPLGSAESLRKNHFVGVGALPLQAVRFPSSKPSRFFAHLRGQSLGLFRGLFKNSNNSINSRFPSSRFHPGDALIILARRALQIQPISFGLYRRSGTGKRSLLKRSPHAEYRIRDGLQPRCEVMRCVWPHR